MLQRRLLLGVEISWARPKTDGSLTGAPQLDPGTDGSWALGASQFATSLNLLYRADGVARPELALYGGLGLAYVYHREAMTAFGQVNLETGGKPGFHVTGGGDWRLGPGAVFAEARYLFAPVDFTVTGASNVGGFSLALGYRLFLL